jgi:ribosome-binding factor A
MPSRRALKVAEAIREVVSMAILAELKDPRIQDVTVTYVEISGDLRHAKVHVSVMGDETRQKLSLRGLQSAAGFLQGKCADRLALRYTPRLQFLLDQGVKKSIEISRILAEVLPAEPSEDLSGDPSDDFPADPSGGTGDEPDAQGSASPPPASREGVLKSDHPPPAAGPEV